MTDEDAIDKALREFRKEHPPKRRKRSGMDRLVDCIEQQLDAHEKAEPKRARVDAIEARVKAALARYKEEVGDARDISHC